MYSRLVILVLIVWASNASAQLQLVPLPRVPAPSFARTKEIELRLPFWDDFSYTSTEAPHDTVWMPGSAVWVNDGMAINPPSIRVATFDGTDATGRPYNVTDVLAKGFADKLESQIIRMDLVSPDVRSEVYMKFYYQIKGRGELPDLGDIFQLQFKTADDKWQTIWTMENDGTLATDVFYQARINIADEAFYHDKFQFRFLNFARLSGPYDTWHLDYVFISNGTNSLEIANFPDRTIVTKGTPLFAPYHAIPYKNFIETGGATLAQPTIVMTNMRPDQVNSNGQPVNLVSSAIITTYSNGSNQIITLPLTNDESIGDALLFGEYRPVPLTKSVQFSDFDTNSDSAKVKFQLKFNTRDNTIRTPTEGDFLPDVYAPIDFRTNDTTTLAYTLAGFYAYDDGHAEYGAGLNQPGAQLAYEFDRVGETNDSIVALDLYFPRFGDETSQIIELRLWETLTDDSNDALYKEVVTLQRNTGNVFWRKQLATPVKVPSKFYVGWKQSTASVIAVGLDKNNDHAEKMYYNTIGSWEQNSLVRGSLMIRPVFGKGKAGVDTGTNESVTMVPYPNPCQGTFFMDGIYSNVSVMDQNGRPVPANTLQHSDRMEVSLHGAAPGIYLVRAFTQGAVLYYKVLVSH